MVNVALMKAALAERKADLIVKGGILVNVLTDETYAADVAVYGSRIAAVGNVSDYAGDLTQFVDASGHYLVPGLLDGHIHIECSKLSITSFANTVVPYGTTSVISGLDQIYVIAGLRGVREFLEEAKRTPLKIFWGTPFKTPYTIPPSTVGHYLTAREHKVSHRWPECVGIWETEKNFVLNADKATYAAMDIASANKLPVFGCAPLTRGKQLSAYINAGIRADHESYSAEEALEKLRNGLYAMIRESSVAHFLRDQIKLVTEKKVNPRRIGFCTDDVTALDVLKKGHLDNLVRMAIEEGLDPMKAIQMATINCAEIYRIDETVGSVSTGRIADILLIDAPEKFNVKKVIANGKLVAADNRMIKLVSPTKRSRNLLKTFKAKLVQPNELGVHTKLKAEKVRALSMVMSDVPFVRKRREVVLGVKNGLVLSDVDQDVLYVTCVERFGKTTHRPSAFISGFQLREGAIASSAAPDDNNILCIGASIADMVLGINHIIKSQGGQAVVKNGKIIEFLPLPVGGIVADMTPQEMVEREGRLDDAARELGCRLPSPFMYMIFLSITGMPEFAITDGGFVDTLLHKVISPILGPA